jgi:hypothetical protein
LDSIYSIVTYEKLLAIMFGTLFIIDFCTIMVKVRPTSF